MNPEVSIIMPVFNAEKTIRKSLDSIRNQTFRNYEVIIIDDGSIDASGSICDEYALLDKRFKVKHKKNEGVSAARQDGIELAKGEYSIHVDPDDWIEPNMLEELLQVAVNNNADMVICDFYENIGKNQRYHQQNPSSLSNGVVLREMFQQLHGSCWNKLIKSICYNEFNVAFPKDVYYCEDLYVVASLLMNPIKIAYCNKAYYHYVQYNGKATLVRYYDVETYSHDMMLKQKFVKLLQDSPFISEKEVAEHFDCLIVYRAFENGFNYYSSRLFKDRFKSLLPVVERNFHGKDKLFLLISIRGGYRIARTLKMLLQRIKGAVRVIVNV